MTERGAVYIAYGEQAQVAAAQSQDSLLTRYVEPDLTVITVDEHTVPDRGTRPGRWAKVNLDHLSPFDQTLYLDADTTVIADLGVGFNLLDAGWDLAIGASRGDWLGHLSAEEREATERELGWRPLQLQAGLFWFCKCARIARLFAAWREEWERWQGEDQGALLRALYRAPVKVALIEQDALIDHDFGVLR